MSKLQKPLKAIVTIEFEINDVETKYPNFMFNYRNKKDFLENFIASLEHNTKFEECLVFKTKHRAYKKKNFDYDFYDDGYKQKVLNVEILK